MQFYTYIHRRADDGKVFYVGKGNGARARSHYGRNPYWRKTAAKHGHAVEIVAKWATEQEAFDHEMFLIGCFRDLGHPLTNMTDGGEGRSGYLLSEEAKQRISRLNTGKKRTEEQRRVNSEARKGKPLLPETVAKIVAANTGRKRSEEARQKMAEKARGRKMSPEHRAKLDAINRGCTRSDETKKRISAGLTGRPVSEETREKIAAAQRGRPVSQEMRDRIADTLRGRKLSDEHRKKSVAHLRSPEVRALHSAAMKGRPWSEARRAAQAKKG